jgi:hypothetical protein
MRQENVGTFHAEPFAGISGSKPKRSRRRKPSRASPLRHQPQRDTEQGAAREPESLAHAIEMREALKQRLVVMQSEVRGLNGKTRSKAVAAITAAQARCSDLSRWIKDRTTPDTSGPKSSDVIASLLAILDRLEEEGVAFTDDEVDAMDVAAECVARKRENDALRAAIHAGKMPTTIDG